MKKLRHLFLAAFATLAFVACSDSELPDVNGGGEVESSEAWMSVAVSMPNAKSRGLYGQKQESGKAVESGITNVMVLVFDGFGSSATLLNKAEYTEAELLPHGSGSNDKTPAFKVSKDAKSVLVVVNPYGLGTLTENVSTYATINRTIETNVSSLIEDNKFMMTNASGKLERQIANTAGSPDELRAPWIEGDLSGSLKDTEELAENSPLSLRVDRVVAKVRVYNDHDNSDTDNNLNVDMTSFGWVLNVTNKKFFPVSERINTQLEQNMVENYPGVVHTYFSTGRTPFDTYNFGSYRRDPNYEVDVNYNPSSNKALYDAEFNYYVDGTNEPGSWSLATNAAINPDDPETPTENAKTNVEYCLENTQVADANYHAWTTHALIKANVYPKEFSAPDSNSSVTGTAGIDWMSIGNAWYTYETLMLYIQEELKYYYSLASPTVDDSPLTTAFNNYLEGITVSKVELSSAVGTTPEEKASDIKTKFETLKTEVAAAGANSVGSVNYYKGGVSYYKVMIKHDNNDAADFMNALGEFGVVRNSVYDIHISAFASPGEPTIPEPDPDTPDEEVNKYLSVEIEINDWTWYSQTESL